MSQLPFFRYNHIFSGPVKLLIKESHAIFTTIPRNQSEMSKSNVITISRRYRSVVHECVENLTKDVENDNQEQIKTFQNLEVIWNLCEILLLDVNQAGTLIIQLKNWIKMHFDQMSTGFREILTSIEDGTLDETGYNEEEYWMLLIKLVLTGETNKAIDALKSHQLYESCNQMQVVSTMLESMPHPNQYIIHEFCNKWVAWTEHCQREKETGQFDKYPALLKIVRLLSKDPTVYEEVASDCDTWYQLMVAYLIYTDPCMKDTDLSELSQRCIRLFKTNHPKYRLNRPDPDDFDEIIISAFEYDLIQVIARCCGYLDDNWWFVTHFIDLLHCSNQLKIHDVVDADKLRETFLQDYATTLFDDGQLWAIGVSYLDSCPHNGIFYLEILLPRIPIDLDEELKAHKIISLARKRGLNSIVGSISLYMARKWISKTPRLYDDSNKLEKHQSVKDTNLPDPVNLSNALYWAVKSDDTPVTTFISDQCLLYYSKTGSFPVMSVFESLKRLPLNNERLAFLAKYYEFKSMINSKDISDGDIAEAGNLIKALIASKIYPRFISEELLRDVRVLLELDPQVVIPTDKTLELMTSIEEITGETKINDDLELRRGLIRNLARALITPVGSDK